MHYLKSFLYYRESVAYRSFTFYYLTYLWS